MSSDQEANERARLLEMLDMLICIASLPELPEMHFDSIQNGCGNRPNGKPKTPWHELRQRVVRPTHEILCLPS